MSNDILIIGIFGNLGDGKTIYLTDLSYKRYQLNNVRPQFSNYTLPYSKHFSNPYDVLAMEHCDCMFDDIIPSYDSRRSGQNILETQFLNTLRKHDVNLCYTAQLVSAVDKRLRLITNVYVFTKQLNGFRFLIYEQDSEGNFIRKPYIRTYSDVILKLYKTSEVVRSKISIKSLREMQTEMENKKGFAFMAKVQFRITYELANIIYDLLNKDKIKNIKELLLPYGYEVTP